MLPAAMDVLWITPRIDKGEAIHTELVGLQRTMSESAFAPLLRRRNDEEQGIAAEIGTRIVKRSAGVIRRRCTEGRV